MGTPPLQSAIGFLACPFPMMSASYHIIEVFDIYQFRNSSITLCSLYTMQDNTVMWEHALSSLMHRTQFTCNM